MPIVLKSGTLELLKPSGLVQACTGIALPFRAIETFPSSGEVKNGWSHIYTLRLCALFTLFFTNFLLTYSLHGAESFLRS
jgi:hypothetical protein